MSAVRARHLVDAALVEASDDAVVVPLAGRTDGRLPYAHVDGLLVGATSVVLSADDGMVVEIVSGDTALGTLARAVAVRLFALPEFMRSLRAFGSSRTGVGDAHDRYFAPLVTPLRALRYAHEEAVVAQPHTAWRAALSLDAGRIAAELRSAIAALAASHCPSSAPHCRSLEAELLDDAEPLFAALDDVARAAQQLGVAPDQERGRAWRAWCRAVTSAIAAADRAWVTSARALAEVPAPRPRGWRRLLSRR